MTVNDEVTAADIARIAGVGRAAVSNWRRRHPDFPRPVGGPPNSPTFCLPDVQAWLTANGRSAPPADPVPAGTGAEGTAPATIALSRAMAALLPPGTGAMLEMPSTGVADIPSSGMAEAIVSLTPPGELPAEVTAWEFGQPSRGDQPLAWVQLCLAHLEPGGTAVVAVPFTAAVRASGRRIRAQLLRTGVLTHVVGLPEQLVIPGAAGGAGGAGPWQLWRLTRPTGRPAYTLRMVDLGGHAPDELPQTGQAWTEVFADPHRTRDLPAIELLDEDVLLVPAAHISVPPRDLFPDHEALRRRYAEARRGLAEAAPAFPPGSAPGARQLVSINDLARSGAVMFVDRDGVRPGDVLVPARAGGFEAFVANPDADSGAGSNGSGGSQPAAAAVLRCDPTMLDPYFLACFLRAETNRRQASGTSGGTFRLDLRRARVPRMTLTQQRRYGEAFRRLMTFAGAAGELAAAAAAVTRTAIDGLTAGTFGPEAQ